MLDINEEFRDGLESMLHVLKIPSRSSSRKQRRDTIFETNERYRNGRKRITTLVAIPSNSLEGEDIENDASSNASFQFFTNF